MMSGRVFASAVYVPHLLTNSGKGCIFRISKSLHELLQEGNCGWRTSTSLVEPLLNSNCVSVFKSYCGTLTPLENLYEPSWEAACVHRKSTTKLKVSRDVSCACRISNSNYNPWRDTDYAYRTSTSLVEDLFEPKYIYRTSTSRDLSKLLQIANYTCRTSIPAFTSICRALNMLAGPLQAFASPCGTLTALAEPIAAFMTHCGI